MSTVPTIVDGQMAIIALTTDPNGSRPTDNALQGAVFSTSGGNALNIFGKVTAAGSLVLMRNLGIDSEWQHQNNKETDNTEKYFRTSTGCSVAQRFS